MKRPVKSLRVQIGVQVGGLVGTTIDVTKHDCKIFQVEGGFEIFHKGRIIYVPDSNVPQAEYDLDYSCKSYEECHERAIDANKPVVTSGKQAQQK